MMLGIGSYTLPWSVGVPGYDMPTNRIHALGLVKLAHHLSYKLVQIADNLPLHSLSLLELKQLHDTAAPLNITIEVGTRGSAPELLLQYLKIATALHSKLVRTLITTNNLSEAERQIRAVLPFYEEAGVTIAIENHGLHTTKQLIQLFENLNSPYVGCCLDTVNSFGALESPDFVIDQLLPYTVNLHVKDFDIQRVNHLMGYTILGTAAGAGRLNIPKLAEQLCIQKKNVNTILELWTPFTETVDKTVALEYEWMLQSLAYLKSLDF